MSDSTFDLNPSVINVFGDTHTRARARARAHTHTHTDMQVLSAAAADVIYAGSRVGFLSGSRSLALNAPDAVVAVARIRGVHPKSCDE
jgi:hypothetical protein